MSPLGNRWLSPRCEKNDDENARIALTRIRSRRDPVVALLSHATPHGRQFMAIHLLKYTGLGLVLVARAAWAAPQYTLTDLGTLGGNYSQANGVNSLGRAVGTAMDSGGHSKAFIYQGGGDTDLGSLGGIYSSAFAVNGSDQAVGQSTIAGEQQ